MSAFINVLLLENDPSSIRLFERKIQTAPMKILVKEARTRTAFIRELEVTKFDCIVIDYNVPDISGLEALRVSKEISPDTPIIVYTDSVGEEKAAECMLEGASDFILKTNSIKLVPTIISLVEKTHERKARIRAEKEKLQSEERFMALAEASTAAIFIYQDDKIIYINPSAEALTGYTKEELLKMRLSELLLPAERDIMQEIQANRKQDAKKINRYEFRIIRKDGKERWVDFAISSIQYDNTIADLGIGLDVTIRKEVEEKLYTSEQRYRIIFDANPQPMLLYNIHSGEILAANDSAILLYGYNKNEFTSMKIEDLIVEKEKALSVIEDGICKHRKKTGEIIEIDTSHSLIEYDGRKVGLLIITDVTVQKRILEILRISEQKYRDIVTWAPIGIYQISPNGKFLIVNKSLVRMLGFDSVDELLNTDIKSICYNEEDKNKLLSKGEQSEYSRQEYILWKKKNGSAIWVQLTSHAVEDEDGNTLYYEGFVHDVTEQKRLESEFRQAQKMESIGILAGGIAHDFNNILNIITGYSSLAKQHIDNPEQLIHDLSTITNAAERGTKLVRQLLTFARKSEVRIESIDINSLIEEIAQFLTATFPKSIEIILKLNPQIPKINADQNQLHQAFLNLAVNARDAMPNGGKLVLSSDLESYEKVREKIIEAPFGDYVHIAFADNGCGMDEETKSKVFDPFFTTKEVGKGTGLGLAVVYGIIGSHNGFIHVESEPNVGTTMHIYLPVFLSQDNLAETAEEDSVDIKEGHEKILIIEDEDPLREYLKHILVEKGYNVLEATNGIEGLNIFEKENNIELIITDLGMPKIDGIKLIKKIKERNHNVKILLMSGNIEPAQRLEILKAGATGIIFKPYHRKEILFRVRQTLDT